jgi:hypothetical protein
MCPSARYVKSITEVIDDRSAATCSASPILSPETSDDERPRIEQAVLDQSCESRQILHACFTASLSPDRPESVT